MTDNKVLQHANMHDWSLSTWLEYLESIHHKSIDMGLERVNTVYQALNIDFNQTTVITVAGTNGKGTTCAMLERLMIEAGKSVCVYGSPHIVTYRERVRVNAEMLPGQSHCDAFLAIERARGETPLTYFEFGTLAAIWLCAQQKSDVVILEVGLGGRLDATNAVDPDIAVITSIGLDHQDWLGDTRELIAKEKAGIFRKSIPAIIGEPEPPITLEQAANDFQVLSSWQGRDFKIESKDGAFSWCNQHTSFDELPLPNIPPANLSTALQVASVAGIELSQAQVTKVIREVALPGRAQIISRMPLVMLDVAHNPQATEYLRKVIERSSYKNLNLRCFHAG